MCYTWGKGGTGDTWGKGGTGDLHVPSCVTHGTGDLNVLHKGNFAV